MIRIIKCDTIDDQTQIAKKSHKGDARSPLIVIRDVRVFEGLFDC